MARCYTPVSIKNPAFGKKAGYQPRTIEVPCGKCYACVQNRRMSWAVRLQEERLNSSSSYFITLTYDNEHVPCDGVRVDAIQTYMKALRRKLDVVGLGKMYKLKYFAVSEYGSITFRAHYHLILFNFPREFEHELVGCWPNGFVHISPRVGDESMMYITKYMLGCSADPDAFQVDPAMPKQLVSLDGVVLNEPFVLMSKGLGRSYVSRMKHWHKDNVERMYVPKGAYKLSMPRYYRERLYDRHQLELRREQMTLKHDKSLQGKTHEDFIVDVLMASSAARRLRKQKLETKLKEKL